MKCDHNMWLSYKELGLTCCDCGTNLVRMDPVKALNCNPSTSENTSGVIFLGGNVSPS